MHPMCCLHIKQPPHVMEYGSTERITSFYVFFFFLCFLLWVLAIRCAAHINYSVKAPLRGTSLNPGLFFTVFPHCRGTVGKCSFYVGSPSKGKLYGFDAGIGFSLQQGALCALICVSARVRGWEGLCVVGCLNRMQWRGGGGGGGVFGVVSRGLETQPQLS